MDTDAVYRLQDDKEEVAVFHTKSFKEGNAREQGNSKNNRLVFQREKERIQHTGKEAYRRKDEAGERLLQWIDRNNVWDVQKMEENMHALELARNKYRENFWDGRGIITNNPDRVLQIQLPRHRHGVCEACFDFGWTEKNSSNRYLCPKCLNAKDVGRAENICCKLQSVSLEAAINYALKGLVRP